MTSNASLIAAGDWALNLFGSLALPDVVAKRRFLLRRAVFAITNRDWRAFAIARARRNFIVHLLGFCVLALQSITVVLAAVSHVESLTL